MKEDACRGVKECENGPREDAREDTEERKGSHPRDHRPWRLAGIIDTVRTPASKECDSECLDETRRGKRPGESEQCDRQGDCEFHRKVCAAESEQQRLECQPLARKSVKGRQGGNRRCADEEKQGRPLQPLNQPA